MPETGRTQRGKDLAELEDDVRWPDGLQIKRLRRDVRIERVRPDTEWEIALELRGHAVEYQAPMFLRAVTELGEQAGLADPGLTLDRHAGRRPAREHAQHRIELCELGVASDERPGKGIGAHPGSSLTQSARVSGIPYLARTDADPRPRSFLLSPEFEGLVEERGGPLLVFGGVGAQT